MNVSVTVGASPLGEGTRTGLIFVFGASAGAEVEATLGTAAGFEGSPVALASSVKPSARPVPSGSMPYSAGNTNAIRMTLAVSSATTVAMTSERTDGTSPSAVDCGEIIWPPHNP